MTTMKKISWASITALTLTFAGCGSSDDDKNNAPTAAPSAIAEGWSELNFLTDCDRVPAGTATGTSTGTSNGTSTGTSTDTAANNEAAPESINSLNERMQMGSLRCVGTGGQTFKVSRDGQYTLPDGTTANLQANQVQEMQSAADKLFQADAVRAVSCETSAQVADDEAIHAVESGGQMRILYAADRQEKRRCFLGDRAEVQRLRLALQPIADRYRAMGSPTEPTPPVTPESPAIPTEPGNAGGTGA